MNEYTFFQDGNGFIESNISHYVNTYCAIFKARELAIGHGHRMPVAMSGFDETSPPSHPYLKAVSVHSATVLQLYVRSGRVNLRPLTYCIRRDSESRKIKLVHSAALQ